MITYFCKYTPVELLRAFGEDVRMPNFETADFSETDTLIHSSVCPHAKMLVLDVLHQPDTTHGGRSAAVFTNCCDSVRRVSDSLPDSCFSFRTMLDLPHAAGESAVRLYAEQLKKLIEAYRNYSGRDFSAGKLIGEWSKSAAAWQNLLHDKGNKIAVMGARVSNELFDRIQNALPFPTVDLTCGGIRALPAPPEGLIQAGEQEILTAYARALLTQIPCSRMEDTAPRKKLLKIPGLKGIVYHTVRFCDYYSFEYAWLLKNSGLPMVKIESDYTSQSVGQLSTRIAAFAESLESRENAADGARSHRRTGAERPAATASSDSGIYVGIDSGSTTTNAAAIGSDGRLLAYTIIRTGAKAGAAADKALSEIRGQLGGRAGEIREVVATGYGREFITAADETVTEISCHAKGAHSWMPDVRTIIDIGGQDSKVICLDENGNVSGFVMNDKCAAGTGRFLEMMAHTLELSMDEMSRLGLKWKKDLTITSTCTVFAESEVVSLIAENAETGDIIHALNKSVASRTVSMVRRVKGKGPMMMTGGVARNEGVVRELERLLGLQLHIPVYPDLAGAYGAALFAREKACF
ncbi:MAG: acyl-CoA dehydratase activase [Lachnospiraceae bacterium]|jgi:predicted CoA-substrate-specific enzyme activase